MACESNKIEEEHEFNNVEDVEDVEGEDDYEKYKLKYDYFRPRSKYQLVLDAHEEMRELLFEFAEEMIPFRFLNQLEELTSCPICEEDYDTDKQHMTENIFRRLEKHIDTEIENSGIPKRLHETVYKIIDLADIGTLRDRKMKVKEMQEEQRKKRLAYPHEEEDE